jgi:hypothetical protein
MDRVGLCGAYSGIDIDIRVGPWASTLSGECEGRWIEKGARSPGIGFV